MQVEEEVLQIQAMLQLAGLVAEEMAVILEQIILLLELTTLAVVAGEAGVQEQLVVVEL